MEFQSHTPYIYVDTESDLDALLVRLSSVHRVAVDIEADSLHHYFEKICLIQITFNEENFIVDPLSGIDISKLLSCLAVKDIVFHGGVYDLRMLFSSYTFKPCGEVFDTMLASQLLGFEKFGLAALLEQFFGVEVCKKGQRADWSRRPLEEHLLEYACTDTRYLLKLAELLAVELDKAGRLDWHRQNCKSMVESTQTKKAASDPDEVWRIKGSHLLRPNQLLYVRQLWRWRDGQARRADLPAFKIMPNGLILKLSAWLVGHRGAMLSRGPNLPRNLTGESLRSLTKSIGEAAAISESQWPGHKKRKPHKHYDPNVKILAEAMRDECGRIAKKLGIEPSLIAPRAALAAIARKRPEGVEEIMKAGSMTQWQAEIIKPAIKRVFKS